jgi:tRNA pseudouridine55 synthase
MTDCADCPKAQSRPRSRWVAPRRDTPLSGILNVDKPSGMTSHDVVDEIRHLAGQRKVGHAGTLDPMATGVLLVCLGAATRVAEYLMQGRKRYRATVVLGTTTDTYDAEGKIVSSGGASDFARSEIEVALTRFVGPIEQVPPMYSAIKRKGRPLYELARQGKTVERPPRPVEIEAIELLDWAPPALSIEVACSPGTYIRSLAHDLGQQLGSGAYLDTLVRLSSGHFALEDATSLDRLAEAFEHGEEDRYLLALDEAFLEWPAAIVGADAARRIVHGQAVNLEGSIRSETGGTMARAYDLDGSFLAILRHDDESGQWRPKKVFAP